MGLFDFFKKDDKKNLVKGLERSREGIFAKLARAITGKSRIDDEVLEELEEVLITSDVGVETTVKIIQHRGSEARQFKSKATVNAIRLIYHCNYCDQNRKRTGLSQA